MSARFDSVAEAIGALTIMFRQRNWLLFAPGLVFQIIAGSLAVTLFVVIWLTVVTTVLAQPTPPTTFHVPVPLVVFFVFFALVAFVVAEFAYAWTLAAAEPIWNGGDPAIGPGFNRATAALGQLILYKLLIALLSILSLLIIVGPIIVAVLAIYGGPYIVLGRRSATQAIGDSFKLVSGNLGETLTLVLMIFVGWFLTIAAIALTAIFPFGPMAASVIFRSSLTLAIERFYLLLSTRPQLTTRGPRPQEAGTTS